eukprot:5011596-Ditylum_brightwellii.AAC.1
MAGKVVLCEDLFLQDGNNLAIVEFHFLLELDPIMVVLGHGCCFDHLNFFINTDIGTQLDI